MRFAPRSGVWSRSRRKSIEKRILRWKPILVVRTANGWRATLVTRIGYVSATAATAYAAQMALFNRGHEQ